MSSHLPVIDLRLFETGSEIERARIVAQVRAALEGIGFMMIAGHGVDQTLIDRVSRASLDFFDRTEQEKLACVTTKPGNRGYNRMRGRTVGIATDPALLKSLQESYGIGRIDVPDEPYFKAPSRQATFAENIWPDKPADFELAMKEYYGEMERVFFTVMRLFAATLDLPPAYFDKKIDRHGSVLRLTHYPALDRAPLPKEERAGAHTDNGILTILHIDDTPDSLAVQLRSGEWIYVNRVPGTFVINIGDLMMRWANDKWVSNVHRVANPPLVNGRTSRRLSLVYFCQCNDDTVVACLPNCTGPENPPRYPPIVAGEYTAMRAALRYGETQPGAKAV